MGYVSTLHGLGRHPTMGSRRVARRVPGRGLGRLGQDDGGGFSWGDFATSIASSAASGAATAGVNLLKNIGTPSALKPVAPPPTTTTALTTPAAGVPIYVWALGGFGLLMIMMLAMRR